MPELQYKQIVDDNENICHFNFRLSGEFKLFTETRIPNELDLINIYFLIDIAHHSNISNFSLDIIDLVHMMYVTRDVVFKPNIWFSISLKEYALQTWWPSIISNGTFDLELRISAQLFNINNTNKVRYINVTHSIINMVLSDWRSKLRYKRSENSNVIGIHRTDCTLDSIIPVRRRCCRHQMEVVFNQLKGFEFIIQPKQFDAGFCHGRCPPRFNPATHHALLQSLIYKQQQKLQIGQSNIDKIPKPCCAPKKLLDLEILHVDEMDPSKLKVTTWNNMKVIECACS